ncbi:MAG: hypothetical protein ACREQC_12495, partial [Candidatus Binataceae bacterium]
MSAAGFGCELAGKLARGATWQYPFALDGRKLYNFIYVDEFGYMLNAGKPACRSDSGRAAAGGHPDGEG